MAPKTTDASDGIALCCPPLLAEPLSAGDAESAATMFRALADPSRVRLVSIIASAQTGEACVCDLIAPLGLSQPTVSHHLKVLHEAGILERERRGSWVYYRLREETLSDMRRALASC